MRPFIRSAAFVVFFGSLVPGVIYSCSQDDEDDDKAPDASEEQINQAAKAFSAASSSPVLDAISGASSNGQSFQFNGHIRKAYGQYLAQQKLLEDGFDASTFCTLLNSCNEEANVDVGDAEEYLDCAVTCRSDSTEPISTCTLTENLAHECSDGVTYTIDKGGVLRYGSSCTLSEGALTWFIDGAYDFVVSTSNGDLDNTAFKCSWKLALALDEDSTESEEGIDDQIGECESFSCTVDGAAVSCEDIKKALKEEDNRCAADEDNGDA